MELIKCKNGMLTAVHDNKFIHSKYDPIKESQSFINTYKKLFCDKVIVVYGIGLGYHIKELRLNIEDEAKIYVFEYNDQLVKMAKSINNSIFKDSKIEIITSKNTNFFEELAQKMKVVNDIIIHKPSLCTIKDINCKLYDLLINFSISRNAIEENKEGLINNKLENQKNKYCGISELIKKFTNKQCKYVIASAGPSLDLDIETIKKYRNKLTIFAVGSALKVLINEGIEPDAIVIIESNDIVAKQIEWCTSREIPLCFLNTTSPIAVNSYKGPKYMFNNENKDDENYMKTGKTVAVSAIDLAVRCNAKSIAMIGQDLACINGRSHNKAFEEIYNEEDYGRKTEGKELVKAYDGSKIKTTRGYLIFKNDIEAVIRENKHIEFYNCSKGVWIEDAIHMILEKYIKLEE